MLLGCVWFFSLYNIMNGYLLPSLPPLMTVNWWSLLLHSSTKLALVGQYWSPFHVCSWEEKRKKRSKNSSFSAVQQWVFVCDTILDMQMRICFSPLLGSFIPSAGRCNLPHSTLKESVSSFSAKQHRGRSRYKWSSRSDSVSLVFSSLIYSLLQYTTKVSAALLGISKMWKIASR